MSWRKIPSWIKGGIYFTSLVLMIVFLKYVTDLTISDSNAFLEWLGSISGLILEPFYLLGDFLRIEISNKSVSDTSAFIFLSISFVALVFLLGAILGYLVEHIKGSKMFKGRNKFDETPRDGIIMVKRLGT